MTSLTTWPANHLLCTMIYEIQNLSGFTFTSDYHRKQPIVDSLIYGTTTDVYERRRARKVDAIPENRK